jgi:hypothetical protein
MSHVEYAFSLGVVVILLRELGSDYIHYVFLEVFLEDGSYGDQIIRFVDYITGAFELFSFVEVIPDGPLLRSDIVRDGSRCEIIRVVSIKAVPCGGVVSDTLLPGGIAQGSLTMETLGHSFQIQTTDQPSDRAPAEAKQGTTHANCNSHGNWAAQERLLWWRYLLPESNLRNGRTPHAIYISPKHREFILIQHRHR